MDSFHSSDAAEQQLNMELQLLRRLNSLPLVHACVQATLDLYGRAKVAVPLIGATMDSTESALRTIGSRAQPLLSYITPQVLAIDRFACSQFAWVESRYPVIKTSPDQVIDYGRRRYGESYLKRGVDMLSSVGCYGREKVNDTIHRCQQVVKAVSSDVGGKSDLGKMIVLTDFVLGSVLDYAEQLAGGIGTDNNDEQASAGRRYSDRLKVLSSQLALGIGHRVTDGYETAKSLTQTALLQLTQSIQLMTMLKVIQDATSARVDYARTQAQKTLNYVSTGVHRLASVADDTTIRAVQLLAVNACLLTNLLSSYSLKYLPENAKGPTEAAVGYVNDLGDTVMRAKSTSELSKELLTEAGQQMQRCRARFLDTVGSVTWTVR